MSATLSVALAAALWSGPSGPFLRRLAEVESNCNPNAVGKKGERGLYQFRKSTWESESMTPFRVAFSPPFSTYIAGKHLSWIVLKLKKELKRTPKAPEVYCAFNLGFHGFAKRGFDLKRCPKKTREASKRFEGIEFK